MMPFFDPRKEVFIIDALRTPIGALDGKLVPLTAPQLGEPIIKAFVERYPFIKDQTDHIVLGNSVSAGLGQNPARQTALMGGIDPRANAFTVNQVCGSGMSVVGLTRSLMVDQGALFSIAGAIESCSNMPYLIYRKDAKNENPRRINALQRDGLFCAIEDIPFGENAEDYAELHRISREEQDEYALESHSRARQARDAGAFGREILPLDLPSGETVGYDECIREKLTAATLGRLKPVYRDGGTITAANASALGDCAAMILLGLQPCIKKYEIQPLVRFLDIYSLGTPLNQVFQGQAQVLAKLLRRNRLRLEDIDIFEICESFSASVLGFLRETGVPPSRVNLWGGDLSLGHPMGATGTRLVVSLTHSLVREEKRYGIALMSMGGGHTIGVLLERYQHRPNPLKNAVLQVSRPKTDKS